MMSRSARQFDWHRIFRRADDCQVLADPRIRMRWLLSLYLVFSGLIFGRCLQLEITAGDHSRQRMLAALTQVEVLAATRGRILARDGTILARDVQVDALLMHYNQLDEPQPRLAELCGLSIGQWKNRCSKIKARVERMAASVNRRRQLSRHVTPSSSSAQSDWTAVVSTAVAAVFSPPEQLPISPIAIREQTEHHTIAVDIPPAVRAQVESHPDRYPGVTVRRVRQRIYPFGQLVSHAVGYVAADGRKFVVGKTGVEGKFDAALSGRRGEGTKRFDAGGNLTSDTIELQSVPGEDVILTIDTGVQKRAEVLLDDALRRTELHFRRQPTDSKSPATIGGAIVVMNVHTGELIALASAPRFNSNDFVRDNSSSKLRWLNNANQAMFHRAVQMVVPPGSAFKPLTAIALLEDDAFDRNAPMVCRGYLHKADRQRCLIFRKYGVGHGPMNLDAAITQSCNVYFFHHAAQSGPRALVHWAACFGFGQRTGIELAHEAGGHLPTPQRFADESRQWTVSDTQAIAIGQGRLMVTPLQIARMMAAIGNGGHLVRSTITRELVTAQVEQETRVAGAKTAIPGLRPETLQTISASLRRVVSDPAGTAYRAFQSLDLTVAGKTGTAQTGAGNEDHAWFAGFAPADRPQFAFAVVLERAGSGAKQAAPVARDLLKHMAEAGWFEERQATADER